MLEGEGGVRGNISVRISISPYTHTQPWDCTQYDPLLLALPFARGNNIPVLDSAAAATAVPRARVEEEREGVEWG